MNSLPELEQICMIVNCGTGSKIIHAAKRLGIPGAVVLLGRGTAHRTILDLLGLTDTRKEIIYMVVDRGTARHALEALGREFKMEKPNHGIAFTTPVCGLVGTRSCQNQSARETEQMSTGAYHAITVIVDKGRAEDVIDAASKAGLKGGTILNGRGSGVHETSRVFSMDIEPEKEIVLILSEREQTQAIVSAIREGIKLDQPGMGILYVQDVSATYGLYK